LSHKPDSPLARRLDAVRRRIAAAETRYGRWPGSVRLLAVGKGHDAIALTELAQLGVTDFGENYLDEAVAKQAVLSGPGMCWHFIGRIQSNKTREIASRFDWVDSVDRLAIARRLSDQRPASLPPLNLCIQVRIGGESSKGGVGPGELPELAASVARLPRLQLRGLMAIPRPVEGLDAQRAQFAILRREFESLCAAGYELDTLSMGMSADLEAAIAEGATVVRIGSALLGPRPARH